MSKRSLDSRQIDVPLRVEVTNQFGAPKRQLAALSLLQLHGDEGPAYCREVARKTGAKVMKAMRVRDASSIRSLEPFHTDFHLLDAFVPGVRGQISFDQHKDWGKGQGAPLTPEYQAIYEENLKTQAKGDSGEWLGISCLGFGMPIMMYGGEPIEIVITPATTYILLNWVEHGRRNLPCEWS